MNMKANVTRVLRTTAEDRRLIAELTAKPVLARLKAGEVEEVDPDDWSDVPELEEEELLSLPADLYRQLKTASRKRRTTPDRLAAKWIAERLRSA